MRRLALLTARKNLRVLVAGALSARAGVEFKPISGGVLLQSSDRIDAAGDDPAHPGSWWPASRPDRATLADLEFAWRACRSVKSERHSAGQGPGFGRGRDGPGETGSIRAGWLSSGPATGRPARWRPRTRSSPSTDGPTILLEAGVTAIVQPGGLDPGRPDDCRRRCGRCHDVLHWYPALLPLRGSDGARRSWTARRPRRPSRPN